MFWERSDSKLTNAELRELSKIEWESPETLRWIEDSPFLSRCHVSISTGWKKGTFNRIYSVNLEDWGFNKPYTHIARFNIKPNLDKFSLYIEQWISNEAIALNFPTPRIAYVDTSCKHAKYPFQIIENVESDTLRNAGSEEQICNVLEQLGKELKKLHSITKYRSFGKVATQGFSSWRYYLVGNIDEHIKYCLKNGLISIEQSRNISRIVNDIPYTMEDSGSLLHGDLSYDNILIDKDTKSLVGVIDWEDALYGDPIFELAGLATFHPESRHKYFIDAYCKGDTVIGGFNHTFWIYYLIISIAKTVHRHRFGYITQTKEGWQNPDNRIQLALEKLSKL